MGQFYLYLILKHTERAASSTSALGFLYHISDVGVIHLQSEVKYKGVWLNFNEPFYCCGQMEHPFRLSALLVHHVFQLLVHFRRKNSSPQCQELASFSPPHAESTAPFSLYKEINSWAWL